MAGAGATGSGNERRGRPAGAMSLGDILRQVARKEGFTQKALQGRRLASKVVYETLRGLGVPSGPEACKVVGLRTGVLNLETDNAALLQEIESFHRGALMKALSDAGLGVREIRARLNRGR